MSTFTKYNKVVEASKRRVTGMWFGDIDRVEISDGSMLTGTAVMFSIFTLSGLYQYYVALFSLSNRVAELWHASPSNTPISEAPDVERELLRDLRLRNIDLQPVPSESSHFSKFLMLLPLAFDDDNCTQPNAKLFDVPGTDSGFTLTKDEKAVLRKFVITQ